MIALEVAVARAFARTDLNSGWHGRAEECSNGEHGCSNGEQEEESRKERVESDVLVSVAKFQEPSPKVKERQNLVSKTASPTSVHAQFPSKGRQFKSAAAAWQVPAERLSEPTIHAPAG